MEIYCDGQNGSRKYTQPETNQDAVTSACEDFAKVAKLADRVLEVKLKEALKTIAAAGLAKLKNG